MSQQCRSGGAAGFRYRLIIIDEAFSPVPEPAQLTADLGQRWVGTEMLIKVARCTGTPSRSRTASSSISPLVAGRTPATSDGSS
jgi:hypothetical protein